MIQNQLDPPRMPRPRRPMKGGISAVVWKMECSAGEQELDGGCVFVGGGFVEGGGAGGVGGVDYGGCCCCC